MAETTPGPLIQVVQFVGFMGAYRNPGTLDPWLAGVLGAHARHVGHLRAVLPVHLPRRPLRRRPPRATTRLAAALAGITAAVVGVIANLALYFAVHTLFADADTRDWGPFQLEVPHARHHQPACRRCRRPRVRAPVQAPPQRPPDPRHLRDRRRRDPPRRQLIAGETPLRWGGAGNVTRTDARSVLLWPSQWCNEATQAWTLEVSNSWRSSGDTSVARRGARGARCSRLLVSVVLVRAPTTRQTWSSTAAQRGTPHGLVRSKAAMAFRIIPTAIVATGDTGCRGRWSHPRNARRVL